MYIHQIATFVFLAGGKALTRWFHHLGAVGLILLGLLDNSVIPTPGSMDLLTIILSAEQPQWWIYYALMATLGSVIGGYVTYELARKGGKEALEKRLSAAKVKKIHASFERWGIGAITVPAMLPPPFPFVPFLLAAGATEYSRIKFLLALTAGRCVRYGLLAFLAETYGRRFVLLGLLEHRTLFIVLAVGVLGSIPVFVLLARRKSSPEHA